MSIALHTRQICSTTTSVLEQIRCFADARGKDLFVSDGAARLLQREGAAASLQQIPCFEEATLAQRKVALLISLGGDGTFLETVHCANKLEIPLLGIRTGNLGFLAQVQPQDAPTALTHFFAGTTRVETRTLLALQQTGMPASFALNEVAILKRDTDSLLIIDAYIDDRLITTYWTDGLIVATPTGSTAYALSCSGPVVLPNSNSFVLTPINPHNLTTRALVVSDAARLRFCVRSRTKRMLVAADGRPMETTTEREIAIQKAPFGAKIVQFGEATIFDALREKLYWGADHRNK